MDPGKRQDLNKHLLAEHTAEETIERRCDDDARELHRRRHEGELLDARSHDHGDELHHMDGTHRSTARSINGAALERHERRIRIHLDDGHTHEPWDGGHT